MHYVKASGIGRPDMEKGLSIVWDKDNFLLDISYYDFINLEISELEFVQISALHIYEEVSIVELCKCYQEQLIGGNNGC